MDKDETKLPAVRPQSRISLAGDQVTICTQNYPEEQRGLIRWLFAWAKDHNLSMREVEDSTKLNQTTLYRVWTGKYVNHQTGEQVDLSGVCERIARFKDLTEERERAGKLPFIETSLFQRVEKLCREALVDQSFAFIYGESQIGKTAALQEVKRRNNHGQTIYVLMPAMCGVQGMMQAIAAECHISVRTNFTELKRRLETYFDPTRLLIVDEVHECFVGHHKTAAVRCLSFLRQLQERTGCGMVLCGTNVFRDELEEGEFAQSLKQLRKRGIWELQLESVASDRDVAMIAKHYQLGEPTGEAAQLVRWINQEMGLGKFTKFLARAAQIAAKQRVPFTWNHFVKVVTIAEALRRKSNQGGKAQ